MEQHDDRETRIGVGLLMGLALFTLVALASFYFQKPVPELSTSIRDNIASTTR
jgi:hypothetical protein